MPLASPDFHFHNKAVKRKDICIEEWKGSDFDLNSTEPNTSLSVYSNRWYYTYPFIHVYKQVYTPYCNFHWEIANVQRTKGICSFHKMPFDFFFHFSILQSNRDVPLVAVSSVNVNEHYSIYNKIENNGHFFLSYTQSFSWILQQTYPVSLHQFLPHFPPPLDHVSVEQRTMLATLCF